MANRADLIANRAFPILLQNCPVFPPKSPIFEIIPAEKRYFAVKELCIESSAVI